MEELVSIITPVFNAEEYLSKTIECVQAQTHKNWEMLLVDDCSNDKSKSIIEKYAKDDERIKYFKQPENKGAAAARNKALEISSGRYIAYLDSDDLWFAQKLERQIAFMKEFKVQFSCCDYDKIDYDGTPMNKVVHMPKSITYNQLLSNTIIQTVGVIVDVSITDKKLLEMPNVRRGQDSATWLQMLRNGVRFTGQNEVLASYTGVRRLL